MSRLLLSEGGHPEIVAYSWTGARLGVVNVAVDNHQPGIRPMPSPDGRHFILAMRTPQGLSRYVSDGTTSQIVSIAPDDQYLWGDDSQHICVLRHAASDPGAGGQISVLDGAGRSRDLVLVPNASAAGGNVVAIVACAPSRGVVVVRTDRAAAVAGSGMGMVVTTVLIQSYSLRTGKLVGSLGPNRLDSAEHASVAPDGSCFAESPPSGKGGSRLRSLGDARLLRSLSDPVVTFSADCQLVVTGTYGQGTSNQVVSVVRVSDGKIVWRAPGIVTRVEREPRGAALAIELQVLAVGSSAPPESQVVYLVSSVGGRLLLKGGSVL